MKQSIIIILMLVMTAFCFANEIAVISTIGGKTSVMRADKSLKHTVGDFIQSSDELQTNAQSWFACKFIDNTAAIRLFSDARTTVLSQQDSLGMQKKLTLKQGSMLVRIVPGTGKSAVLTNIGIVHADSSLFLIKTTSQGETRVVVLEGMVELSLPGSKESEKVLAGSTAIIDKSLQTTVRSTFESDFSPEEYAFLDPQPIPEPQQITIPMVGPDGKTKYLELNW